ncbi:MAG: hypothetical protein GX971_15210 [Firmicutes bacterium]|nr:hypothetical protein [Bacillota bacterium]
MKSDSLFLGIDGGRSGTRCIVVNGTGEIIGQGNAGRTDFVLAPGGKDKLRETLTTALTQALPNQKFKFKSAFLGLSGVIKGGELEEAVREVCTQVFEAEKVEVDTDAYVAWAGALKLQPGIVLIAGSGSIALGVGSHGETARSGGWGFLFGDEGGGFGIARDGLKMVLRSIDHNQPCTALIDLYTEFFQGTQPSQLARDFYAGKVPRDVFARITPEIAALARRGDQAAQELFASAGEALARDVQAVSKKLKWPSEEVYWSPVGGVFKSKEMILDPIRTFLDQDDQYRFKLMQPQFPPVLGAVLLAMQQAEGKVSPKALENLAKHITE